MAQLRAKKSVSVAMTMIIAGAAALVSGCKNNTTSASDNIKKGPAGPPPTVTVLPATQNPSKLNPLTDSVWKSAPWHPLVHPENSSKATPEVRAAMLYDASNFYVAFVCATVPPPGSPIAQDVVSVYLDSSDERNGRNLAHIAVNSATGEASCVTISGSLAKAKEDGTPDWLHPYATTQRVVKNLSARTGTGVENGNPVWTAVITIPMKELPKPFPQAPTPGAEWKVNLLRSIYTTDIGNGAEHLQRNLSPVYLGAQSISPYRLATIRFADQPAVAK